MEYALIAVLALLLGLFLGHRLAAQKRDEEAVPAALYSDIQERHQKLEAEHKSSQAELIDLHRNLTAQEAIIDALREEMKEKEKYREELEKQARALWEQSAERMLSSRAKSLAQEQEQQFQALLQPFQQRLLGLEKSIEQHYQSEHEQRAQLTGQIKQLSELNKTMSEEARQLVQALKGGNKLQGNWGELVLERLLEVSGLEKGREYQSQETLFAEDGRRKQPDIIINLPGERQVLIDAKMSLDAYLLYQQSEDEQARAQALKQHIQSVKNHVRELSKKNYQGLHQLNSLDFVLLFMPIEAAFALLMQEESQLFTEAFQKNIIIVSPTTLLASLRTIANLWQQAKQQGLAEQIAREAGIIHDALVQHTEGLLKLKNRLQLSMNEMQDIENRLRSGPRNLLARIQRLEKLGAKTTKQLGKDWQHYEEEEEDANEA